ncbi:aminotransferase class I/II-fold pyridoxal phosphate-dependent enzyme [Nocardia otitidiscaviarum]|uniref:Aminotransferase class I/II-fold pyridoxal phosphate-dependent enzyme n=1 Tax=Nocardia otitidiscaviarum TaxID=1823 RepID=A0A516NRY4_9NOCA|nr:aminotransferase class I/II-fold pyridoxal phosphate-dependent enzyme [Nocardia otitidiscaviarum]MBF6179734.1 aminotransferase class I/II-fold pyridoxal phosphate-dependent enzyme [Nocardia otitidiscaviarum]MCP9620896.1 aminotransferase class I/II-fold pyridoxal phosphate-dependent enzyme [Nocardia otitidiscaviarum]QDP81676.1 aminotransferase class I/II-fold pyridoxal phosphate-dependent enzyme [Nocardia otitidiscaviarum]
MNHRFELGARTSRSEERKREVRRYLGAAQWFPGTEGRIYPEVIDAYHGETGLAPDAKAVAALDRAWNELLRLERPAEYRDGVLYDKRQPMILRELAADKLFGRLWQPTAEVAGVRVRPEEVVVCPYSSTVLLEEAVATLARPGGVIVCPEGFYKSSSIHVEKYGLAIVTCPATADDAFRIDPEALARCLDGYAAQGRLCGVLLTLPGNPVVADYSAEQLGEIGRVLLERDVPVICDMAFDRLVEHIPLAAVRVAGADGVRRMYDRVLTVTGNSKGYNAFGPCKFGAACTGDAVWLREVRERLTIAFQRETTHLVRATLEHTGEEYFTANRARMRAQLERARVRIEGLNARVGVPVLRPLGSLQGMFLSVVFDRAILESAGVHSSAQLEDVLLAAAGIDSVALDRTGSPRLGVRLNVLAPRKAPGSESADLLDELFDRIERLVLDMVAGLTYGQVLAGRGLPELPEFAAAS